MSTFKRFEDIIVWQKSRVLTQDVYRTLRSCRDPGFTDQIQRAAVSVMSNIAEGFESGTKELFLRYLYIAKGSAGEVRAQLYVASDAGYIDSEKFKSLTSKAEEVSKLLSALIKGVKSSEFAGLRHRRELTTREREVREMDRQHLEILAHANPAVWRREYERKYGALPEDTKS